MALSSSDMKNKQKYKPMPNTTESDYTRFWGRAILTANQNNCWYWQGAKDTAGYGSFSVGGINYTSNRFAYFLYHNADPKIMHVLHKCDNKTCVNPNHLFLGTNYDNVLDKMAKGRQGRPIGALSGASTHPEKILRGSKIGTSKLIESDIIIIRTKYLNGNISTYALAKEYNMTQSNMWAIVNKKIWKHI